MSPNLSGSAERPTLPWVYPYQDDGTRLDSVVMRPIVPIILVGQEVSNPVFALVDSGCEHVLAAPWLAPETRVKPSGSDRTVILGLGGENHEVRFVDMRIRLLAPGGDDDQYIEWDDEVGFLKQWRPQWPMLVGQTAFMKRFTVTMSRHAQAVAIEDTEVFDERFEAPVASESTPKGSPYFALGHRS